MNLRSQIDRQNFDGCPCQKKSQTVSGYLLVRTSLHTSIMYTFSAAVFAVRDCQAFY